MNFACIKELRRVKQSTGDVSGKSWGSAPRRSRDGTAREGVGAAPLGGAEAAPSGEEHDGAMLRHPVGNPKRKV
jgi:hypothetical protein